MISGEGRPEDVDRGFAEGADDYLVKPFRRAEMLRRVKGLLLASGR
jgi:DNA-binding response OmpR family regulator